MQGHSRAHKTDSPEKRGSGRGRLRKVEGGKPRRIAIRKFGTRHKVKETAEQRGRSQSDLGRAEYRDHQLGQQIGQNVVVAMFEIQHLAPGAGEEHSNIKASS